MKNNNCCGSLNKVLLNISAVIFIIFVVALTVFVGASIQNKIKQTKYVGQGIQPTNTISITETGEIFAKPDLAKVSFSVVTEAKNVADALSDNAGNMNNVINFIKSEGVLEKDIKTTNFSIYPRYEYEKGETESYYPSGKRTLVGYEVSQQLTVNIRDLEKVGEIIEGTTNAGANVVGDLQFTIDNQEELKKQARAQAIEKAKNKAKEIASQIGVNLARITNFSENAYYPSPLYESKAPSLGIGGGGETPQIQTGENKISVTIVITYELSN